MAEEIVPEPALTGEDRPAIGGIGSVASYPPAPPFAPSAPIPPADAPPHPRVAFTYRDYNIFQTSKSIATIGWFMQTIAVEYQVYQLTKSTLYLAYVALAAFAPAVLLALITGHVADRHDRRRVAQLCQAAAVITSGTLFFLARHVYAHPEHAHQVVYSIIGVVALSGAAHAFYGPATQAMVPSLVRREHLHNAITWNSTLWQGMAVLGPALGGLALQRLGASGVYVIDVCMGFLAAITMGMMKPLTSHIVDEDESASFNALLAGVRFVWQRKVVLGAISMDLFAVLLGGATALLPVYAQDILKVGPVGFGWLRTAPAIGAAVTAAAMAYLPPMKRSGHLMFGAVAIFGVATIAFGVSKNYAVSIACLVILGAADMVSVVIRHVLVQAMTPPEMRGRVSAVNLLFIGASNELGGFESGILAHWVGTVATVVIGGIGTMIVVVGWAWLFPELRRFGALEEAHYDNDHAPRRDASTE